MLFSIMLMVAAWTFFLWIIFSNLKYIKCALNDFFQKNKKVKVVENEEDKKVEVLEKGEDEVPVDEDIIWNSFYNKFVQVNEEISTLIGERDISEINFYDEKFIFNDVICWTKTCWMIINRHKIVRFFHKGIVEAPITEIQELSIDNLKKSMSLIRLANIINVLSKAMEKNVKMKVQSYDEQQHWNKKLIQEVYKKCM